MYHYSGGLSVDPILITQEDMPPPRMMNAACPASAILPCEQFCDCSRSSHAPPIFSITISDKKPSNLQHVYRNPHLLLTASILRRAVSGFVEPLSANPRLTGYLNPDRQMMQEVLCDVP